MAQDRFSQGIAAHSLLFNQPMGRWLLGALLVAMMILPSFAFGVAQEPGSPSAPAPTSSSDAVEELAKSEVVYGHLAGNGSVGELYVVNLFEDTPATLVTDYGDYSEVRNLSNSNPITQENDQITFDGTGEAFNYQGLLQNTNLPWFIAIGYALDGQAQSSDTLGGKSGQLELTIQTSRNTAVNATYFDNFLMQISLTLPSRCVHSIHTEDGQVARAGSDYTVTFMAMPESEGSFTLNATVEDFEMGAINFAAVPLSFVLDPPDTSDLINGFNELGDGVNALSDGASSLSDGAATLSDGISSLAEGVGEFSTGLATLNEGAEELSEGVNATAEGAQSLADNTVSLKEGGDSLAFGTVAIATSVNELVGGLQQFQQGLNDSAEKSEAQASSLQNSDNPDGSGLQEAIKAYSEAYATAYSEAFGEAFGEAYAAAAAQGAVQSSDLSGVIEKASQSAAISAAHNKNVQVAAAQVGNAAQSIAKAAANLAGQIGGLTGAAQALRSTADNMDPLIDGAEQLAEGTSKLADGSKSLANGLGGFSDGIAALAEGANGLAEGAGSLASGTNDAAVGAQELAQGSADLADGSSTLAEGASTLTDGTSELSGEVSKMPDKVQQQIDDMLASYDRSDYQPISYTSPKNTHIQLVQFVLSTDPIKAPEEEVVEEPTEEPSFIDRLLALFF